MRRRSARGRDEVVIAGLLGWLEFYDRIRPSFLLAEHSEGTR